MDRKEIERQLEKLDVKAQIAFAYRCALRVFPILGRNGNFDYWEKKERKTTVVALFRVLCAAFIPSHIYTAGDASFATQKSSEEPAIQVATAVVALANAVEDIADLHSEYVVIEAIDTYTATYLAAYGIIESFNEEILADLDSAKQGINILTLPLWKNEPPKFREALANFEKALTDNGLGFWVDVYRQHLENRIDMQALAQRINIPKEIIAQGGVAITVYLESLQKKAITAFQEVKVHFVGNGGAGKTCLKDLIQQRDFTEHPSTPGIDYEEVVDVEVGQIGKVKAYLWDFGGQEKMHTVHTFFFSERSIYLLVLDSRKEEDPEYWLEMIDSYAKDCQVLVVLNKQDANPAFDLNRQFLKKKYPNIKGFYPISCKDRDKYKKENDAFKEAFEEAIGAVGHITAPISGDWLRLKQEIQDNFKNKDFISEDEYRRLCARFNIDREQEQGTLLCFLNDLGILLHYPEEHLRYTEVLNPRWLTCAVYKFLHDDDIIKQQGRFTERDFNRVLDGIKEYPYPGTHRPHILYLMEKFLIAFRLSSASRDYLIPVLLKDEQPAKLPFQGQAMINLEIRYPEFFPKSIIPNFICLNSEAICESPWRTGVVLRERPNNYLLVQGDEKAKRITISAYGDNPQDFLSYIRLVFHNQLHGKIANLKAVEYIPLPDRTPSGETRFVEYANLLGMWKRGVFQYHDGIVGQSYSIPDLLGRLESQAESKKRMEKENVPFALNVNVSNTIAVDIKVEVKTNISLLIDSFNNVKDELLVRAPELATDLTVVEKQLAAMERCGSDKEALIKSGAMDGVRRFLERLGDENSTLCKTLNGIEKGHEILSEIASGYNAVAEWLALPQVPKRLLKG